MVLLWRRKISKLIKIDETLSKNVYLKILGLVPSGGAIVEEGFI